MHDGMRGENYNFADIVQAARQRCEKAFETGASEAVPVEGDDTEHWNYEEEFNLLREEMRSVADQCRKDETKKMVNVIEVRLVNFWNISVTVIERALQRNFKRQISEPVDICLSKPTPDMWDKVLVTFRDTLGKAESSYLVKAKS